MLHIDCDAYTVKFARKNSYFRLEEDFIEISELSKLLVPSYLPTHIVKILYGSEMSTLAHFKG